VKNITAGFNKVFESKIRLGIMSALYVNESLDFTRLKELLDVTDGNLASHIHALEESGYVSINKQFIGRKPNTSYTITHGGREAFHEHILVLEKIIKNL
jgi:DNA-binding MarR family transcriptional regulator